jgi:hypothetical protein
MPNFNRNGSGSSRRYARIQGSRRWILERPVKKASTPVKNPIME